MAFEKHYSPRGILGPYPKLNKPDTKFDADGVYSASLMVPLEKAQRFIDNIEKAYEDNYQTVVSKLKRGKKPPKKADMPYEVEDDTVTFKFKLKATVTKKDGTTFERRPALFDSKGKIIKEDVLIGQGSVVQFASVFYFWQSPTLGVGLTLQPEAVKVFHREEPSYEPDADAYDFDEDEDGYSVEDEMSEGGEEDTPDNNYTPEEGDDEEPEDF
ncbi:hypothetical protein [Zooshikella sp. RANM57]|uniref:hypothetical protein n=1 Tax=Zooshikella sp. RANM57 TaxID=3425863 RepID=UPI003D6E21B2